MQRKANNKNNPSRQRRLAKRQDQSALMRYINPFKHQVRKRINTAYSVYAVGNTTIGSAYSFSGVTTQTTATLSKDIYSDLVSNAEFSDLQADFGLFRIMSVEFRIVPTAYTLSTIYDLPPLFAAMQFNYQGSLNSTNIAKSDQALEIKVNSQGSESIVAKYDLKQAVFNSSGYPICGELIWQQLSSATPGSNLINLQLGYLMAPTFTSSSSQAFRVASIDVYFNIDVAMPLDY